MRRYLKLAIVLPVLATLAVGLALIGWHRQGVPAPDLVFKALPVLTAGGDYAKAETFANSPWIEAARWFGLAFFLLTVRKAFGLLLARQWNELRSQFARRDLVLVGPDPVLAGLARFLARRRSVLWLDGATQQVEGARVIARPWERLLIRRFRLGRASAVIVSQGAQELRALATARELCQSGVSGEVVLLTAGLSEDASRSLPAEFDPIRIVTADELAIRSVHETHPPFAIARRLGHARIHAVIVGGHATGERVIADLLLSSRTSFLERPRVTIVDHAAAAVRAHWAARAPGLALVADLQVIAAPAGAHAYALPLDELRAAAAADPFTIVYVCAPGDRDALATALAWDDVARREGWNPGAIVFRQTGAPPDTPLGRLIPFGTSAQIADSLGLMGGEHDRLARKLHDAYRATAPATAVANRPWEALSQDLRRANYLSIMHVVAKLASADADLDRYLEARRAGDVRATPPLFPDLAADPALVERLARLEHERWMIERTLAGWTFGPVRDNARRNHPDLMPFEQLSTTVQDYDRALVRGLADALRA